MEKEERDRDAHKQRAAEQRTGIHQKRPQKKITEIMNALPYKEKKIT